MWYWSFPLFANPLRQSSHLNGRLCSGKWRIICSSYVTSLASSFPHSRHLKNGHKHFEFKKKDWHQQEPKVQVPIMCKTYTVLPSTFWSTILNILFNSIWTIIKLSTWISNSVMQITGLVVKHDDFCLNYISSHKKSVYQCDWHKLVHLHLSQPNHSPLVKRIIRICCGHTMWYTAFWVWLNGDIDLLD